MADEIRYRHIVTGVNVYGIIRNWITGQVVIQATGVTEVQVNANWGNYDVPLLEDTPAAGYFYMGDMPAAGASVYTVEVYLRAGGAPALTDTLLARLDPFYWNGTAASSLFSNIDRNAALIESQRGYHTWQGNFYYVDPVNGDTHASGNRGGRNDPYLTIQDCHDNAATDSNHDVILLVAGAAAGVTTHTVAATTTISKRYVFIRGPGRDFIVTRTGAGDTFNITADGIEISGVQIGTDGIGAGNGVTISAVDFHRIHHCWFLDTRGDGIHCERGSNCQFHDNHFEGTGTVGAGQGIHITGAGGAGNANDNVIRRNHFGSTDGTAILIDGGTTDDTVIAHNEIHDAGAGGTGWGIDITTSSDKAIVHDNLLGNNQDGNIRDNGTNTIRKNNREWLSATNATTQDNESNTLDVTLTGAGGVDWGNVENPTTVVVLSGTTVGVVTALPAAERDALADVVLSRDVSNAEPVAEEHTLRFIICQMMESDLTTNSGFLTVHDTSGAEIATKRVTSDAAAVPITGIT